MKFQYRIALLVFVSCFFFCGQTQTKEASPDPSNEALTNELSSEISNGADRIDQYLFLLENKLVGLVVNNTSEVNGVHLVDTLNSLGINIKTIFAPEHGFRSDADAGASIADGKDIVTGAPIISLYGSKKKPSSSDLSGLEMLVFDIQDVGARFYTYISTMTYVMEACAENNIPVLILDRPNPNGHYVDGPVLEEKHKSFIGMHPVPVVHGMTIAEYATMVNGEGWLANGVRCDLNYVLCENYDHNTRYSLPFKPSPNLPNDDAIQFYPSLCFFEGTVISVGRGTDSPFQIFGHPQLPADAPLRFTPEPTAGASQPKLNGELCYGYDVRNGEPMEFVDGQLNLDYLIFSYWLLKGMGDFYRKDGFFELLAGTDQLRQQINEGITAEEIRMSWRADLDNYKAIREKYLLYPDFE